MTIPTMTSIELLNTSVLMPDLTIGQAIDIANIQQRHNEQRISALIGHISGNASLAATLTVQERYFFLLNHRDLSDHSYATTGNSEPFFIDTIQSEVIDEVVVGTITVQHLRGAHACVIEGLCEDLYDWICGQIACQLYGDLSSAIGGENPSFKWDQIPLDANSSDIEAIIKTRFELISDLTTDQFNELVFAFDSGCQQLMHFVQISCDMDGLTLIKQGGEKAGQPSRFHALSHLQGTAARIIERIAIGRHDDNGTRQDELD